MNIKLNDLLRYLDFLRKIWAVHDVVATCDTFYSLGVILKAKRHFLTPLAKMMRYVHRHVGGVNPPKSNLEDLVNAMSKCHNDGVSLPLLAALPFSSSFC